MNKETGLPEEAEKAAKKFFDSLSEKDKRRYAAALYLTLGCRSLGYIRLLDISYKTIKKGQAEPAQETLPNPGRQRRKGGGRNTKWNDPDLNKEFHKAGDPVISADTNRTYALIRLCLSI